MASPAAPASTALKREQITYLVRCALPEDVEVVAALAEATHRIRLYGSVALPIIHPAITARPGATIDHTSRGRFGINLLSGRQKAEYERMGLWPGDGHELHRYWYDREYVDMLKLLWTQHDVDYEGEFFHFRDCRLLPPPPRPLLLRHTATLAPSQPPRVRD
jgi:pyrimidine oxygenase